MCVVDLIYLNSSICGARSCRTLTSACGYLAEEFPALLWLQVSDSKTMPW